MWERKRRVTGTMILCVREGMTLGKSRDTIDTMQVETCGSLLMASHFSVQDEVSSQGEREDGRGHREVSDDRRYETEPRRVVE